MRAVFLVILFATITVAGCTAPRWQKAGMSVSQVEAQKRGCWNYVLNTEKGKRAANQMQIAQTALNGPLFLAVELSKPQREQASNIHVFSACMRKQGYVMTNKEL